MTELKKTQNTMQTCVLWVLQIKHDSQNSGLQPHHHLLRGTSLPSATIVPQMQSLMCLVLHLGF